MWLQSFCKLHLLKTVLNCWIEKYRHSSHFKMVGSGHSRSCIYGIFNGNLPAQVHWLGGWRYPRLGIKEWFWGSKTSPPDEPPDGPPDDRSSDGSPDRLPRAKTSRDKHQQQHGASVNTFHLQLDIHYSLVTSSQDTFICYHFSDFWAIWAFTFCDTVLWLNFCKNKET